MSRSPARLSPWPVKDSLEEMLAEITPEAKFKEFQETGVEWVVQDQMSSALPGADIVVAPLAEALEIDRKNVRVICEHMGGGFGSKLGPSATGS